MAAGYTEQSKIVTGLRGVGKTVLLGEYEKIANEESWVPIKAEVSKNTEFGPQIANLARRALFQVSPKARWTARAREAGATLKSFSLTVRPDGSLTAGLDMEAAHGRADSGDLNDDLADVFVAIGRAAQDHGQGVVFLFDEIQFLKKAELEALVGAVHRVVQYQLPLTFAGAGLPQLPGLAGDAKSYAERLFKFPMIGELIGDAPREALVEPARQEQVDFDQRAVEAIITYTEGYPYFIQEFGRAVWDIAEGPTLTLEDATRAQGVVESELDESFFRARIQRSTAEERRYMRAMAELGSTEQKASDVAEVLGKASEQIAPLRARLISKGLLYTPRYGYAKFTVPQFDRFMRRYMDLDKPQPAEH